MTLHHSFTTRPASLLFNGPTVIRNRHDLAAYLYAPAAPVPASTRVCAMVELDRKLHAIVTGRSA